jgi:hypothetical protein
MIHVAVTRDSVFVRFRAPLHRVKYFCQDILYRTSGKNQNQVAQKQQVEKLLRTRPNAELQ